MHVAWINPAAQRGLRKARLDFHPIGQELLYACRCRTKQRRALVVFDQVNVDRVNTGGRFAGGGIAELDKTGFGQRELFCLDPEIARVHNFRFDRQTLEITLPVALLHDSADMDLVAGPVYATLGENERVEAIRPDVLYAFDLESREIQHPVIPRKREKCNIVSVA